MLWEWWLFLGFEAGHGADALPFRPQPIINPSHPGTVWRGAGMSQAIKFPQSECIVPHQHYVRESASSAGAMQDAGPVCAGPSAASPLRPNQIPLLFPLVKSEALQASSEMMMGWDLCLTKHFQKPGLNSEINLVPSRGLGVIIP